MKIDSREVMNALDFDSAYDRRNWTDRKCYDDAIYRIIDEACRRYAERWGVTGRRVDGFIYQTGHDQSDRTRWEVVKTRNEFSTVAAVLYIADPPKVMSDREKIVAALNEHREVVHAGHRCDGDTHSCRMARILRGEPAP